MPVLASLNDIYRVHSSAQDIIKRALRIIGALESGEALPADQLKDGLETFNDMLDSWNTENLIIWVLARTGFTLTSGTNPHEIGPGSAVLDSPRPNRIEQGQAFLTGAGLGTTEHELKIWTRERWERQYDSALSGIPAALYYEAIMPLANIWTDVKPDAAYTLILHLEQMLHQVFLEGSAGNGTTTELSLPPGYKEAITFNLAIALAPEYGKDPSLVVIKNAVEGKASIKRMNMKPLYLSMDPALTPRRSGVIDRATFRRGF